MEPNYFFIFSRRHRTCFVITILRNVTIISARGNVADKSTRGPCIARSESLIPSNIDCIPYFFNFSFKKISKLFIN